MSLATLDPKKCILTFAGSPITGFAKGTFIKVSRTSDAFTKETGADGLTTRVKSNDRSGTVEFTLSQASLANQIFSKCARLDEQTGAMIVPFTMTDMSGTSESFSANAWVRKIADVEYGAEHKERTWVIDCADLQTNVGGNFSPADIASDIASSISSLAEAV